MIERNKEKILNFKENLKKKIKEVGYTQEEFANKLGIGHSTLRTYCSSKSITIPDLDLFCEMCIELETDPDVLMGMDRFKEKTLADFTTDELLAEIKRRIEAP